MSISVHVPGIGIPYEYLGLGTIVIEDYAEPEVKLDLFGGTSGTYAGFDAFGRVVDQVWKDYGADPDAVIEEYRYGYNVVGQPRWKENVVACDNSVDLDELYTCDEVFRLIGVERADLTASHDAFENKVIEEIPLSANDPYSITLDTTSIKGKGRAKRGVPPNL